MKYHVYRKEGQHIPYNQAYFKKESLYVKWTKGPNLTFSKVIKNICSNISQLMYAGKNSDYDMKYISSEIQHPKYKAYYCQN